MFWLYLSKIFQDFSHSTYEQQILFGIEDQGNLLSCVITYEEKWKMPKFHVPLKKKCWNDQDKSNIQLLSLDNTLQLSIILFSVHHRWKLSISIVYSGNLWYMILCWIFWNYLRTSAYWLLQLYQGRQFKDINKREPKFDPCGTPVVELYLLELKPW